MLECGKVPTRLFHISPSPNRQKPINQNCTSRLNLRLLVNSNQDRDIPQASAFRPSRPYFRYPRLFPGRWYASLSCRMESAPILDYAVIEDARTRWLLTLLDGTRNISELIGTVWANPSERVSDGPDGAEVWVRREINAFACSGLLSPSTPK